MSSRPGAVVLLSGGIDSTTVLGIAQEQGFETHAITFRYGQRHAMEIESAHRIAERMQVAQHVVVEFDLRVFGGSALTADIAVPQDRSVEEMGQGIPVTYVPARTRSFSRLHRKALADGAIPVCCAGKPLSKSERRTRFITATRFEEE